MGEQGRSCAAPLLDMCADESVYVNFAGREKIASVGLRLPRNDRGRTAVPPSQEKRKGLPAAAL